MRIAMWIAYTESPAIFQAIRNAIRTAHSDRPYASSKS